MNRKKVLLVDDNVSQLDLIQILFEHDGFHVEQAISGINALAQLKSEQNIPDLIVIDVMMPKISGPETVKKIRALGINCPIIAFTSMDEEAIHQDAINAGCDLVLVKPCNPERLLNEVRKLLASRELH